MADLLIDTSELRRKARVLYRVCTLLRSVQSDAYAIAGVVGHAGLASKVNEFGNVWDCNRERLAKRIERVADGLTAIADTFEDLDETLARNVGGC